MLQRQTITPEMIEEVNKEKEEKLNSLQGQKKFDEKNYLNVRLNKDKGETSKEIRIRLLPISSDCGAPFKRVHMHYTPVNPRVDKSGFKSYICLKKTEGIDKDKFGTTCPFCDLSKSYWTESEKASTPSESEELKNLSRRFRSNEYAILRCIERGHEDEGPKFWKFHVRKDGTDPMNTIYNLYSTRRKESIEEEYGIDFLKKSREEQEEIFARDGFTPMNILDVFEGKDLKITITSVLDSSNNLSNSTSISITDYGKVKPLSDSNEQIDLWVNDSKQWNDVFAVKSYDYLKLISENKIPFFDKKNNEWIEFIDYTNKQQNTQQDEDEVNKELLGVSVNQAPVESPRQKVTEVKSSVNDNIDSDLPF